MNKPTTFYDVVALWPTSGDLARDIGVKEVTARAWKARGIPGEYWVEVEKAAAARGFETVTVGLLAEIAARDAGRRDRPANQVSAA